MLLLLTIILGQTSGTDTAQPDNVPFLDAPGVVDLSSVVARVGPEILTLRDYYVLRNFFISSGWGEDITAGEIIDAWIEQEIVYQEALRMGLDREDTLRFLLDALQFQYDIERKNLVFQAWVEAKASQIEVSENEIKQFFRKHKDDFLHEVKLSQIVLTDASQAAFVHRQLTSGADFYQTAIEFTLDTLKGEPTAYLPRGAPYFPSYDIEDSVFALGPGEFTSPLIISQGIIVIFRLEDKAKVRRDVSLDDVRPYVEYRLRYERSEQVLLDELTSLREQASPYIEVHVDNVVED